MTQRAPEGKYTGDERRLYAAFELGWTSWKIAFGIGLGEKPYEVAVRARDLEGLKRAIGRARERFGVSAQAVVVSCYEAGRDGFWLHRFLESIGVNNVVVDSSSIEVNRRARRAKSDGLDAFKLLTMLERYDLGERRVWSVVHVPTAKEEDARHLHRHLRTLRKEQTRSINRIKGFLANVGASIGWGRRGLAVPLEQIRLWDGSALPPGLRDRLAGELERYGFTHRQILDLENERTRQLRDASAGMERALLRLRGIGPTAATVYVREFFGWRKLKNRRQVGALAGLTPTPFQSGETSHERGISRAGNRHVRGIAIDLAWMWLRVQPGSRLTRWYKRRFARGSSRIRKIGIVALARRILVALWKYTAWGTLPEGALMKPELAA